MASMLALGLVSSAARAASAPVTSLLAERLESQTRMPLSVSVPVLSAHTTSTRASPSIAGSSCTRHWRRPRRTTPTANAIDVSSTRPSGTIGTSAPTIRSTALAPADVGGEQLGVDGQEAGGHQQVGDELQDLVDTAAQFGFHQGELAGLVGELGGVRLPADFGGPVGAGAGDDEAARHHRVADAPCAIGSASPVSSDSSTSSAEASTTSPSTTIWSPGAEFDDVVEHHLVGRQLGGAGLAGAPWAWPARRSRACPESAWRAVPE